MSNEDIVESKWGTELEKEIDGSKRNMCHVPPMKINSELEVVIGNKNKIIYVCAGKPQYFTASAVCCSCNDIIEIEYCGRNIKCICGEPIISGCLGYYKIVKSGLIFIPRHKLSEFHEEWFPTDILCFKAKEKNGNDVKEVKFDVVFTYFCEPVCDKNCRC